MLLCSVSSTTDAMLSTLTLDLQTKSVYVPLPASKTQRSWVTM